MNFELARHHMIEQQLRPSEVLDTGTVELLYADRREDFVPAAYRALAFADIRIPLGASAEMLSPKLEARIMQTLAIQPHERVLEIGTGSGHMAAMLAARAQAVWSIEIDPALAAQAKTNLVRRGVGNVTVEVGDGLAGLAAQAPFDVIVLSGGVADIPDVLLDQLKVGGRLLGFVGSDPVMTMRLITRSSTDALVTKDLMETVVPPLQQPLAKRFAF